MAECRRRNITPHVAQNITGNRGSAIDNLWAQMTGAAYNSLGMARMEGAV